MKARVYLFFFTLLVCSAAAPAQSDIHHGRSNSVHRSLSTLSGGINLRSVEGAPFSADVVNETVEAMPDGTNSRHATHGKMFRDSAGRTRSETELIGPNAGAAPRRFVTIIDPIEQLSIVLDVAAQTASVSHLPSAPATSVNNVKLAATQAALQRGSKRNTSADTEVLGEMMMEGFSVTGSRHTRPAEAGAAGKVAVESWFCSELKIELLATTQVSQSGLQSMTRTTRLTSIVPAEPDPSLFQIPIGYAVRGNLQQKRGSE
jgi:hypothetical protein